MTDTCNSCGTPWTEHSGVQLLCRQLRDMAERLEPAPRPAPGPLEPAPLPERIRLQMRAIEPGVVDLDGDWSHIYSLLDECLKSFQYMHDAKCFGEQCYQDRCENAYVEASVVKRLEQQLVTLRESMQAIAEGAVDPVSCASEALKRTEVPDGQG